MPTHQGATLAYDDAGSGPLVICSPSMGDLRAEFRFLAPQLVAAGYRVITLDVRGHGETSTRWDDFSVAGVGADLLALIDHLAAGPALLIGNSMSAGAAVWAAAEDPARVAGLVLIGPFVRGETSAMMRLMYGVMFARPWGPAMWTMYYKNLYPSRKPADFAEYTRTLRANLAQPGRMEALQGMLTASKGASAERVGRVSAPALVVMGSKDPAAEAGWLADALHAEKRMIDGAGHYPHAEMPEVVGPVIVSFLRGLAARAS